MNTRTKKRLLIFTGIFATLLLALNIYGRQPFNPQGNDTVNFNQAVLKPGKNPVEYLSHGNQISANLFIPPDYQAGEKRPTIIITPPNTGVKEQTAGLYAEKLSEEGFITLAFDPRGFGESGGHDALFDLPRQIEDVRASVDFVTTLEAVDQDNIFNMGICVGAAISTQATAVDDRIKAQLMVSPVFLTPEENILPIPMDVAYIMSGLAKTVFKLTGYDLPLGPLVMRDASDDDEPEVNLGAGMDEYYPEGLPGYAPTWKNYFSLISMVKVMEWYDFFAVANQFESTPVYMVYGTEAFSRPGAEKFYEMVTGAKENLVLEGAGHFDIYWMDTYVNPTVEGLTTFIKQQLNN